MESSVPVVFDSCSKSSLENCVIWFPYNSWFAIIINHLTSETQSAAASSLPFNCQFACGALQILSPFKSAIKSKSCLDCILHWPITSLKKKIKKWQIHMKIHPSAVTQPSVTVLPASSCSLGVHLNARVGALLRADVVPFKKKWSKNENMMWLRDQILFAASNPEHRGEKPALLWIAYSERCNHLLLANVSNQIFSGVLFNRI